MKRRKPWQTMTTAELDEATREFDSSDYEPRFLKPPPEEAARMARARARAQRAAAQSPISILLEPDLVEAVDNYASGRGMSFSEVVSAALRGVVRRKSA